MPAICTRALRHILPPTSADLKRDADHAFAMTVMAIMPRPCPRLYCPPISTRQTRFNRFLNDLPAGTRSNTDTGARKILAVPRRYPTASLNSPVYSLVLANTAIFRRDEAHSSLLHNSFAFLSSSISLNKFGESLTYF